MKKLTKIVFANFALAAGVLLAGCNSQTEKDRKELANAEEQALETTEEVDKEVADTSDTTKMANAKEDLLEANQKLNEKQQKYLASLKEEEVKLRDRIAKLDTKIQSSDAAAKKRLATKRDKAVKERDLLQANILEMAKPMEDKRLETVQKEVQQRIVAINQELSRE
jgi:chromosome segregation ATPase